MKKITSTPTDKKKIINLNNISFKNKILSGLINFDNFLLSIRFSSRVEGNYVVFGVHLPKNNTLIRVKIRVSTFNSIFKRLTEIRQKVNKDATNME